MHSRHTYTNVCLGGAWMSHSIALQQCSRCGLLEGALRSKRVSCFDATLPIYV